MSKTAAKAEAPWVLLLRSAALVVWFGAIPLVLWLPIGMQLFWTVIIAVIPLGIVLGGYHPWRRICPLAAISQVPGWLGRPGQRKVSGWMVQEAMLLQLGLMVAALSLRLLGANGTPAVLVGLLTTVSLAALITGALFRGKTWCNYVCPMGMVEKIYTEPVALIDSANSQCLTCTACKKNCPDIDLEQGYWREFDGRARRVAYYSWPGLVLGFYTWFFLFDGTWEHYFSGEWTRRIMTPADLWSPGLHALPALPWLLSPTLVLVAFGAASLGAFSLLESQALRRGVSPKRARHRLLTGAGFTAFIVFYIFAGQPTLRVLPEWGRTAIVGGVWFTGSWMFFRRWVRSERDWVRERFARKLLKRWTWGDAPDHPEDLNEVYVVHHERKREQKQKLAAYRDTLAEMAAEGALTRDRLTLLGTVRAQLSISEKEHDTCVAQLEAADRALFDADAISSAEQRLQLSQYRQLVEEEITTAAREGRAPDADRLAWLRARHGIDASTHEQLVTELSDPEGALARHLHGICDRLDRLGGWARHSRGVSEDPRADLITELLRERAAVAMDQLLATHTALGDVPTDAPGATWLNVDAPTLVLEHSPLSATRLAALQAPWREPPAPTAPPAEPPAEPALAQALTWWAHERQDPRLDSLVDLRRVGLLSSVSPTDLSPLVQALGQHSLAQGQPLCTQGEPGDEVYILLSGSARVWLAQAPQDTLREMGPGDVVGELAVLDGAPRSANVTATEDMTMLVLPGAAFREVMAEQPGVVAGVLQELVRRLRS